MKPEIIYKYGIILVISLLILNSIVEYHEKTGKPLSNVSRTLVGIGAFGVTKEFINGLWKYCIKKGWIKNENN